MAAELLLSVVWELPLLVLLRAADGCGGVRGLFAAAGASAADQVALRALHDVE
jgi:hypothetical protein